jgi:riboflavin synthase
MFTGIVQAIGEVRSITQTGGDSRLVIAAPAALLTGIAIGDSIAANGCCLTATVLGADSFTADASRETLTVTTLGTWRVGERVNLETALRAGQPLGGHYVLGHVDGVTTVAAIDGDARSNRVQFDMPLALARYIARKGSVCIDGVSLTVNEVDARRFGVNLIPHTLQETILKQYKVGTRINLEVDIVARYLERLGYGPLGSDQHAVV